MPTFKGQQFRRLDASNPMSPGEVEAIEKAVGLSWPKIKRMMEKCVCDHGSKAHIHKLEDGSEDTENTSCESCDCPEHESDIPTAIGNAMTWIAVRRAIPTTKLSDIQNCSREDMVLDDGEDEPDPTNLPQTAESPA